MAENPHSNEVYSWGVGEYDPEYCCDGVGGASATGFEAVPGFEVGDDLFDLPSDLVDGPVVVLAGFWLGWSGWFLDGGVVMSQSDVSLVCGVPGVRGHLVGSLL